MRVGALTVLGDVLPLNGLGLVMKLPSVCALIGMRLQGLFVCSPHKGQLNTLEFVFFNHAGDLKNLEAEVETTREDGKVCVACSRL